MASCSVTCFTVTTKGYSLGRSGTVVHGSLSQCYNSTAAFCSCTAVPVGTRSSALELLHGPYAAALYNLMLLGATSCDPCNNSDASKPGTYGDAADYTGHGSVFHFASPAAASFSSSKASLLLSSSTDAGEPLEDPSMPWRLCLLARSNEESFVVAGHLQGACRDCQGGGCSCALQGVGEQQPPAGGVGDWHCTVPPRNPDGILPSVAPPSCQRYAVHIVVPLCCS